MEPSRDGGRKLWLSLALAALLTVLLTACGTGAGDGGGGAGIPSGLGGGMTSIGASLQDFSITLDKDQVPAGEVTFNVENNGPSIHEFVVVEADGRAPDALPLDDQGEVAEDDLTVVDELEDIAVGSTEELTVDLQPGDYIVFCNIDEHYSSGMNAGFTVE